MTLKNPVDTLFSDVRPLSHAEELAAATVTHNGSATRHKIKSTPWVKVPTDVHSLHAGSGNLPRIAGGYGQEYRPD